MLEAKLWESLKRGFERFRPRLHCVRVENTAGSGIPDLTICHEGKESWVELKIKRGRKIEFRAAQHAWIAQGLAAGRRIFVLVRENDDIRIYRIRHPGDTLQLQDWPSAVPADWEGSIPLDWDSMVQFFWTSP